MRFSRFALVLGLSLLTADMAHAEISVVVTSKPIHSLVAGVMSGIGVPRLLVDGQASPHTYAMKPSDALSLSKASVFFRISDTLEPFTVKLLKSLPRTVRVESLLETPGVELFDRREGGAFEPDHDQDHQGGGGHAGHRTRGVPDPHAWLNPDNAKAMTREIARVLAETTPEQSETIRKNADAVIARIDRLAAELDQELRPLAGKRFVVYHDAYQYFERRFGLVAVGSVTVSPDVPPGGRRLQELRRKIASSGAVCVFSEPFFDDRLSGAVVEGTLARTAMLDPEGMTLEAGPELYFALMRKLAAGFKSCLER